MSDCRPSVIMQPPPPRPPPPRLWNDLRLALATLYSTSSGGSSESNHGGAGTTPERRPSSKEAHDFLMHLQSRNVRRQIQSLKQRLQDTTQNNKEFMHHHDNSTESDTAGLVSQPQLLLLQQQQQQQQRIEMKSTWLTCLYALLVEGFVHSTTSTEQLFGAQTILYTLTRAKLNESIDWDVEQPNDWTSDECLLFYLHHQQLPNLEASYRHWVRNMNPFLSAVLNAVSLSPVQGLDDEARIKGELSLFTLVAIMYSVAQQQHQTSSWSESEHGFHSSSSSSSSPSVTPILTTLGAAVALLALRLRYALSPTQDSMAVVPTGPCLVVRIADALSTVWSVVVRETATTNLLSLHSNSNNNHPPPSSWALGVTLHACLAALPDTLLGSPGGARCRISIDPRCLQAATHELRTIGLVQLWEALQHLNHELTQTDVLTTSIRDGWTLTTIGRWATYVRIPSDLLHHLSPLLHQYIMTVKEDDGSQGMINQRLALGSVMAVCEFATWTLEKILAHNLGFSEHQKPAPATKKRQTSRSRKRNKNLLETNTTEAVLTDAMDEIERRGESACQVISAAWLPLSEMVRRDLSLCTSDAHTVDGEGPIGCLAVAAESCLPFLVRHPSYPGGHELFIAVASLFQELCHSPCKSVRGVSFEALYSLRKATLENPVDYRMQVLVVEHFFVVRRLVIFNVVTLCVAGSFLTVVFVIVRYEIGVELRVSGRILRRLGC